MKVQNKTITLSPEETLDAERASKEVLGKKNVSGLFRYFLNKYKKENW